MYNETLENIKEYFTDIVNDHLIHSKDTRLFESISKSLEDFIEKIEYDKLYVAVLLHDEFEKRIDKSDAVDDIYLDLLRESFEYVDWVKVAEEFLERHIKAMLPV